MTLEYLKPHGLGRMHKVHNTSGKRCPWRKINIGVDEQTLEVRAIEITCRNVGDAPMLPELLGHP